MSADNRGLKKKLCSQCSGSIKAGAKLKFSSGAVLWCCKPCAFKLINANWQTRSALKRQDSQAVLPPPAPLQAPPTTEGGAGSLRRRERAIANVQANVAPVVQARLQTLQSTDVPRERRFSIRPVGQSVLGSPSVFLEAIEGDRSALDASQKSPFQRCENADKIVDSYGFLVEQDVMKVRAPT
jgi:hypothetical protein